MLINCWERDISLNYHCDMIREENIATTNSVMLEDNSQYFYTMRSFELKNILGNIIAELKEFVFIKNEEKIEHYCYKLYQTKEGNWYDIADTKYPIDYNILRCLKTAMDKKETESSWLTSK